ncbi:nucleoside triphosphate pyrophosphohydrolase [bacterium]|nr:nucleoside triphosphate pyrophosphohydrolase [bacterium]MBU1985271.1 nucleoside triphosphate pyrophosphohydrolase [bacterium]
MIRAREEFSRLLDIMARLRAPDGCPWDREQTHRSLRPYLIEETYEVLDSIDREAYGELRKELGDLLLHIVFHCRIAEEENLFNVADVLQAINDKLIRRHPHVFGDGEVKDARHVERQWEKIKLEEPHRPRLLEGVPKHQPALNRAFRVQEKAAGVGFDWPDVGPIWSKIREEIAELETEVQAENERRIEAEIGDLLFSIVNLSRKLGVSPEDALRTSVEKFTRRFNYIEETLTKNGRSLHDSNLEEMDALWDQAKKGEVE